MTICLVDTLANILKLLLEAQYKLFLCHWHFGLNVLCMFNHFLSDSSKHNIVTHIIPPQKFIITSAFADKIY